MGLKAYIDDSYTANGEFILAGHISTDERWAAFDSQWRAGLKKFGTLARNGSYHFKMSEMASNKERMERLPFFWRTIQDHVLVSLSCRINLFELHCAINRIYSPGVHIDYGFWKNPFLAASKCLLDKFHQNRSELPCLPIDQPVDFIFDQQSGKRILQQSWDRYVSNRETELQRFYGKTPRFEDDQKLLPLQAADFWAWWVREWSEQRGDMRQRFADLNFGSWSGKRSAKVVVHHISFNENHLAKHFMRSMREITGPGRIIYDLGSTGFLSRE